MSSKDPRKGWAPRRSAPALTSYRAAQLAARYRMSAIDARLGEQIADAIVAYAAFIEAQLDGPIGALPAADLRRRAAEIAQDIAIRSHAQLIERLMRAATQARTLSFTDILAIWQEASLVLANARGIPDLMLGAVRTPGLLMLGAYESIRDGYTWKTALQLRALQGSDEIAHVLRAGLSAGLDARDLARRIRRYVVGAEDLQPLFEGVAGRDGVVRRIDPQRIPAELRGAARQMKYNAERIAFTEVHNARAEAEVQMMLADPAIGAIRWTLSPNRGALKPPDICDAFAKLDQYGLGAGVFPIGRVPPSPHPFDRCERLPVERPADQWNQPKLDIEPVLRPVATNIRGRLGFATTPKRAAAIAEEVAAWQDAMSSFARGQRQRQIQALAAAVDRGSED